jgi:hypothetical protein
MLVNKTIYDLFRLFVLSVEVPVFFNRSAIFSNNETIIKVASIKPTDDALEVFISALNKQSVLFFMYKTGLYASGNHLLKSLYSYSDNKANT